MSQRTIQYFQNVQTKRISPGFTSTTLRQLCQHPSGKNVSVLTLQKERWPDSFPLWPSQSPASSLASLLPGDLILNFFSNARISSSIQHFFINSIIDTFKAKLAICSFMFMLSHLSFSLLSTS